MVNSVGMRMSAGTHDCDGSFPHRDFAASELMSDRLREQIGYWSAQGFTNITIAQMIGRTDSRVSEALDGGGRGHNGFDAETVDIFSKALCAILGGPELMYVRRGQGLQRISAAVPKYAVLAQHLLPFFRLPPQTTWGPAMDGTMPDPEADDPSDAKAEFAVVDDTDLPLELVREPWPRRMTLLAEWWSQWSTCRWLATGAVIFDADWQVLTSGFNGAPRGLPHCTHRPPLKDAGGHCLICCHAEANAILQAARLGIALRGATLVCTHRPCVRCALLICQVGIAKVYWQRPYDSDGSSHVVMAMFRDAGMADAGFAEAM